MLADLELNEIKQKLRIVTEDATASDVNSNAGLVRLSEEDIDVYLNEYYFVLEDVCVNRKRYSDNEKF